MTIVDFTDNFLPRLVSHYVNNEMPLHALVDIDLWRRIFPDHLGTPDQFLWYQIGFTCNQLQDDTLLFSFTLPEPTQKGDPKFAAIRLDLQNRDKRRAILYTLRKPASIYDDWDIFYLPLPNRQNRLERKFITKINGTDSLRNFVYSVQQIEFDENDYDRNFLDRLKRFFGDSVAPIEPRS